MRIEIKEKENHFYYTVCEHRAVQFHQLLNDETLGTKLKFVDDFLKSVNVKGYTRREVLRNFAKTDKQIAEYYKQNFPKGGYRKNAGRKAGVFTTTAKSERTARFTKAITNEEKEFLTRCLKYYRTAKENSPELLPRILTQLEAIQTV